MLRFTLLRNSGSLNEKWQMLLSWGLVSSTSRLNKGLWRILFMTSNWRITKLNHCMWTECPLMKWKESSQDTLLGIIKITSASSLNYLELVKKNAKGKYWLFLRFYLLTEKSKSSLKKMCSKWLYHRPISMIGSRYFNGIPKT